MLSYYFYKSVTKLLPRAGIDLPQEAFRACKSRRKAQIKRVGMKLKTGLMAATAVVAMTAYAHAQDSSSMSNADAIAQIKALQARVEALEQQLQGAKTKRGKHKTVVVVAAPASCNAPTRRVTNRRWPSSRRKWSAA